MFFNLDKNSKQNLLNEYKQEALNYTQKKKDERQKRIQEEREYMAEREKLEKEADEKILREKLQRKNAQKEEYQSMLMKTKNNIPGYRHNVHKNKNDIILNNWGGQEISHQIQNNPQIQNQNINNNLQSNASKLENNIIAQTNDDQNASWKGRRGRSFRNEDHLNNLLNDNRNEQDANMYMKGEKENRQKYKDLLYTQFQEANNKNLNMYGTNDPLILERKKKRYVSENPFTKKNNYEFGKSTLSHNPITDPQNNMDYNKYLRFSESNQNINNRNNNRNNIQIQNNNYDNNFNNNNRQMDEFKSNNYDTSNMNMNMNRPEFNNNYNQIGLNNNNNGYQTGQNQNNGYVNNSFRPTPSGERIRQAAASNFF